MKKLIIICAIATMILAIGSVANADWQPGDGSKMHYPQLPDPCGWDVAFDSMLPTLQRPLADDWQCSQTGAVSDIHLWISWLGDEDSEITALHVAIYSDMPANPYTEPFSRPNDILWERLLEPTNVISYGSGDQGFFSPFGGYPIRNDHDDFYQINITDIQSPFIQEEGTIYWLVIDAFWDTGEEQGEYFMPGWKTSENHFNDGAVYLENGLWWQLVYPENDPQGRVGNLDLAFVITPEPATIVMLAIGSLAFIRRKK